MAGYALRRILAAIPVMAMVALIVFLILHLTPGDPATVMAGDEATPAQVEEIRRQLGLDQPLYVQFFAWLGHIVTGDLGTSLFSGKPVMELIGQRLEPTLLLTAMAMVFAVALSVPLGLIAAARAGTGADFGIIAFAVLGFSVPVFVVGYMLIFVFSITLGWLPVQGYAPLSDGVVGTFRSLLLPAIALGLAYVALIARVTRASVLESLSQDYIRTARAKGAGPRRILLRHALRNAGVPIVTVIGIGFAVVVSGVVVTETVFNIPGLGRLTMDAISRRDYPVIQAMILVFSGAYVVINVIVDLLYSLIDPRIRYSGKTR